jgi:2,3-dihydroxybenzoate decarboxylase
MKRIAVEEAFVTQEISEQWESFLHSGASDEPGFQKMGETILADLPSMSTTSSAVLVYVPGATMTSSPSLEASIAA